MKSVQERIDEFVEYHIRGDGECNNDVLKSIADSEGLSYSERCDLAYFFAITYSVVSALILARTEAEERKNIKKRLIFQSDRKYVAMGERYEKLIEYYESRLEGRWGNLKDLIVNNSVVDLEKGLKIVQSWYYFGRFAAFLFLETYCCLNNYHAINAKIKWKEGDTATSGLMNVYGHDEAANVFDKRKYIPVKPQLLDDMLAHLQKLIREKGGDDNTTKVETSLCAYRKFYKGSRYNGYYLDRMLEELISMNEEHTEVCECVYEARKKLYCAKMLGENGGWRGIRKEMKKYYLNYGEVNDLHCYVQRKMPI